MSEDKGFKVQDKRISHEDKEQTAQAEAQAEAQTKAEGQESSGSEQSTAEESSQGQQQSQPGQTPPLPKVSFATFVMSMASSAMVQLGEVPEPETGQTNEDLNLAKHTIDVLVMLKDKIDNGLDNDERRLLDGLLYELRMKYVMKNK